MARIAEFIPLRRLRSFGGGIDALFEYGDYKKFSVSTETAIQ